jgi:NAD+ synthase
VHSAEVANVAGLTAEQVERAWHEIEARRRASRYVHEPALLVEPAETPRYPN